MKPNSDQPESMDHLKLSMRDRCDRSKFKRLPGRPLTDVQRHISVCICTYKRLPFLKRLLEHLLEQETEGLFTYSIIVVDNDSLRSAADLVSELAVGSSIPIKYCFENRQSIPLARNKAVEQACGDFIAFIDDDEFPIRRWLLTLLQALDKYNADGVQGPVMRHFDEQAPNWFVKGNFCQRATYPTGLILDWQKGRTGNVLIRKEVFAGVVRPFSPEFRTGEDQDFFRRMIEKGYVFVWCNEAVAYEVVPPIRWKRTFMLKRALFGGTHSCLDPTFGAADIAKSLIAVAVYTTALPFVFVLGQHKFMSLMEKEFYHFGKLLGAAGIDLIRVPYVTE